MNTFNIYKKRDGQSFKLVSYILADSFEQAQKEFALNMTNDNHNKSNNIVWLNSETDGVNETGWYDLNSGSLTFNEETEKYDADEAADLLLVSESVIKEGFSSWSEDVYTWEIRDFQDYTEIYDMDDFEKEKANYSFFMAVDGERFFLYNGKFEDISQTECFGFYHPTNDKFMGCPINEIEMIETYLN